MQQPAQVSVPQPAVVSSSANFESTRGPEAASEDELFNMTFRNISMINQAQREGHLGSPDSALSIRMNRAGLGAFNLPEITFHSTHGISISEQAVTREHYLPIAKRSLPIMERMAEIEKAHYYEMLLKTILHMWLDMKREINPAQFMTFLYQFPFACRALNQETLNRVTYGIETF